MDDLATTAGTEERAFLSRAQEPSEDEQLLARISNGFRRGFRFFRDVGPCVTGFGSARFPESDLVHSTDDPEQAVRYIVENRDRARETS